MVLPTPLDELRRPHPDQASIDREAVAVLLRSAKLGPTWPKRAAAGSDKGIDSPGLRSQPPRPTQS